MVCKFVYFEVIILTGISILTEAVVRIRKIHRKLKSLFDWLQIQERLCISWLTSLREGMCLFESSVVHGLLVLLFYDIKKFIKVLLRSSWIRWYIITAYRPFPDILTWKHAFVWFLSPHYCVEEVFSPNITLLRLHVKI